MRIESLKLIATEDDLNDLFTKLVTLPQKIRDLRVQIVEDRLSVTGVYEMILPIPFESVWDIDVCDGKIAARLAVLKASGVGAGFLKGYILSAMGSKTNLLQLREETLFLDLDSLLMSTAVPVRANLTSIRCDGGRMIIQVGC